MKTTTSQSISPIPVVLRASMPALPSKSVDSAAAAACNQLEGTLRRGLVANGFGITTFATATWARHEHKPYLQRPREKLL